MALVRSIFNIELTMKSCGGFISRLYHGKNLLPSSNSSTNYLPISFMKFPEYNAGLEKVTVDPRKDILFKSVVQPKINKNCIHFPTLVESLSFMQNGLLPKYEEPAMYTPIEEPFSQSIVPLETSKADIKWRRRRMRRHKLLRWRKKYPQLVKAMEERKLAKRAAKQRENLEQSWKMFGLTKEPPKLSEEEKERLQKQWREEGTWIDPLTVEEYKGFELVSRIMYFADKK